MEVAARDDVIQAGTNGHVMRSRIVPRTLTDWFMDGVTPILPTLTQAGGWCRASGLFSNHNPTSRRRFMQRPIVTTHCTLQACKEDHGSPPFTRSRRTIRFLLLILLIPPSPDVWTSSYGRHCHQGKYM